MCLQAAGGAEADQPPKRRQQVLSCLLLSARRRILGAQYESQLGFARAPQESSVQVEEGIACMRAHLDGLEPVHWVAERLAAEIEFAAFAVRYGQRWKEGCAGLEVANVGEGHCMQTPRC